MIGEPDMSIPTTPADATPDACADRLQRILDTPPLKVTLDGGLPGGPYSMKNPYLVLVERGELIEAIRHLRGQFDKPHTAMGDPNGPEATKAACIGRSGE